jgi:methyl acetate hydrolase
VQAFTDAAGRGLQFRLNQTFGSAVDEKRVPGIALNRDSSTIFKQSWGTTNIDDPYSPLDKSSTKVQIASMTKAITCTAALHLVEQGKLSLEDLVETYPQQFSGTQILEGFTDAGEPFYHAPKTNPFSPTRRV